MNALVALTRYSLRKVRGPMIALCVLLFGLQLLMTMIAGTFEVSGQFSQLAGFIPAFIRPMLDPSFMAALSFSGMVCFGYSHVIVILLLTAQSIAAGTELADEVESKFVDLLIARPIPRALIVARSTILIVSLTLVATSSMVAGSLVGLNLLAPESAAKPRLGLILALASNLALLVIAWGAIAMCFAAVAKRRGIAASGAALLAFALFVIDFTGRLWQPVDRLAAISPFRYYAPFPIIAGEPLPSAHVGVLVAIFAIGVAISLVAYQRRDL